MDAAHYCIAKGSTLDSVSAVIQQIWVLKLGVSKIFGSYRCKNFCDGPLHILFDLLWFSRSAGLLESCYPSGLYVGLYKSPI